MLIVIIKQNHALIWQSHMLIQQFKDEQERRDEIAAGRAEQTTIELQLIQGTLEGVLEAVSKPAVKTREGEIIGMIAEKLNYDYVERAQQYFREADYANAYTAFSRALQYQRRNATVQFYQTYALYLRHKDAALSDSELVVLQGLIRHLQGIDFREQEQLDFTVEEMRQKLEEMEHNIGTLQQQMEQSRNSRWEDAPDDTEKNEKSIEEY
ncbi:MAG: hypothetical protein LBH20_00925 [Treponema sp.]|nr:hypothetical protein [Treponema sp.]